MNRSVDFSVDIPESDDEALVLPITDGAHTYLGVAVDLTDSLVDARYRFALTEQEARDLHAALGAALAEMPVHP